MNTHKNTARFLGAAFLFVALASLLSGQILISLGIEITGAPVNISETMINISENPTTMQMGIVVMLIEAVVIVLLAVLLYTSLESQNKIIARWGFGLWIVEAVSLTIRAISAFSLLNISLEFVLVGAPGSSYFQTLGSLFYGLTQFSYSVLMVCYCIGGFLFYFLFFKSNYIPRLLSLWGMAAVSLGFVGTLLEIFQFNVPLYVFLPIFPFELAIGIWLVVKGFNLSPTASEPAGTGTTGIK